MFKNESAAERLVKLVFPEKCISCGCALDSENRSKEPLLAQYFCEKCGSDVPRMTKRHKKATIPLVYDGSVKRAMLNLKFSSDISSVPFFSRELEREIRTTLYGEHFDILTCVPATKRSLAERGYNQSRLIAEGMKLDIETDFTLLRKNKVTQTQHLLDAEQRQKNIASAYEMNAGRNVSGKRILLVDDILTTGSTCDACALVLRLAGAKSVTAVCVAKAPDK
ncbi:MAG: ComF family protein [Clostridia bacterium]|nr:ComF family protein [Clostridia bacterium]MBR5976306.1 ComF family protein [Clostridia bacterium]